jgi:hypothetical protein
MRRASGGCIVAPAAPHHGEVQWPPRPKVIASTRGLAALAATGDAARILGAERDLVILDADPLADIRNTRRISAVMQDGRSVDRAALRARQGHEEGRCPRPSGPGYREGSARQ